MNDYAICISGQPRYYEKGYEQILKHILEINQYDIFIHSWLNLDDPYREKILNLYKPLDYIIEPQRGDFPEMKHYSYYVKPNVRSDVFTMFSMFYSIKAANQLKIKNEEKEGKKYKCVLRIRFDSGILQNFHPDQYDLTKKALYFSNSIKTDAVICDWFDFGNSEVMDIFSNTYDNINQFYEEGITVCGENLSTHQLDINQIQWIPCPISLFLIRDDKFKDKSWFGKMW